MKIMNTIYHFVGLGICLWTINVIAVAIEAGKSRFMQESISYLRKWFTPSAAFFYIIFFIIEDPPVLLEKVAITLSVVSLVFFLTTTIDDVLLFFTNNSASQLIITIARLLIIIISLFACASIVWNIDLAEISTAMGLVTLGISLSFQTILSDLFAGVTTALSRTITLYEYVEIQLDDGTEITGEVTEVGWRYLFIMTEDETIITIPHSRLNTALFIRKLDSNR